MGGHHGRRDRSKRATRCPRPPVRDVGGPEGAGRAGSPGPDALGRPGGPREPSRRPGTCDHRAARGLVHRSRPDAIASRRPRTSQPGRPGRRDRRARCFDRWPGMERSRWPRSRFDGSAPRTMRWRGAGRRPGETPTTVWHTGAVANGRSRARTSRRVARHPHAVGHRSWRIRRSWPSVLTWRSPSRSVRSTRAPCARSRSMVSGAGCPYGLPVPALTIATRGLERVEPRLGRGRPTAVVGDLEHVESAACQRRCRSSSSRGSTSSSMSPVSSIRRSPYRRSSTIEVSLTARPTLGDRAGTSPRMGHRTTMGTPSSDSRSPAARWRVLTRATASQRAEGRVAGSRTEHPVLGDRGDPVPLEQAWPARPRGPRGGG